MSNQAPTTPGMAKKKSKHKKNKGNTDNSTKKRKREEREAEEEVIPDPEPAQRPAKKPKKHNDPQTSTTPPTKTDDDLLQQHSPFVKQTTSFYLALSPCAYNFPLEGLCAEHISPLLLTYFPPLNGVVLSYENPQMLEHPSDGVQVKSSKEAKTVLSRSIDEYAVTYVWFTADFMLFRPKRGTYLEGYVSLQNESVLGLVCYNYFNAVIEREKLPQDWEWIEDEEQAEAPKKKRKKAIQGAGYWVDGRGNSVEGKLDFRVEDFEASPGSDTGAGTVSILGTLLRKDEGT